MTYCFPHKYHQGLHMTIKTMLTWKKAVYKSIVFKAEKQ